MSRDRMIFKVVALLRRSTFNKVLAVQIARSGKFTLPGITYAGEERDYWLKLYKEIQRIFGNSIRVAHGGFAEPSQLHFKNRRCLLHITCPFSGDPQLQERSRFKSIEFKDVSEFDLEALVLTGDLLSDALILPKAERQDRLCLME